MTVDNANIVRVLVTGGNGFIGASVVRALTSSGRRVTCLLRDPNRTTRIAGLPFDRAVGDVRDIASLRAAMSRCDATIHLAAPGGWERDDPRLLNDVIEGGTFNVLDVAGSLGSHRVVVVSSTAAIAASDIPQVFDENAAFAVGDPTLHYAHAKHRAELSTLAACARGVQAVIVNPAEVYGPGDTGLVSAGNLVDFATSRPVLVCHGGTSVVHVADVAAGILAALDRGTVGQRYILGGENLTIRQLAELVLELVGRRSPIVTVPNGAARTLSRLVIALKLRVPFNPHVVPYATKFWFVDSSKARRELGVTFRNARDTILPTLEWLANGGYIPRFASPNDNRLTMIAHKDLSAGPTVDRDAPGT
jgi:dihydroflavonol-4-reductase